MSVVGDEKGLTIVRHLNIFDSENGSHKKSDF